MILHRLILVDHKDAVAQRHSAVATFTVRFHNLAFAILVSVCLWCCLSAHAQPPGVVITNDASRTWYNAKMKVKFEAEFVAMKDGLVYMLKQRQMTHRPLADLSQEDQIFLTKETLPSGKYTLTRELNGRKDSSEVTVKATGSCITVLTKRIGLDIPHKGYVDGKNISFHAHVHFGSTFTPIDAKFSGTWDATGAVGTVEYTGSGRNGRPNKNIKGKFTLIRKGAGSKPTSP